MMRAGRIAACAEGRRARRGQDRIEQGQDATSASVGGYVCIADGGFFMKKSHYLALAAALAACVTWSSTGAPARAQNSTGAPATPGPQHRADQPGLRAKTAFAVGRSRQHTHAGRSTRRADGTDIPAAFDRRFAGRNDRHRSPGDAVRKRVGRIWRAAALRAHQFIRSDYSGEIFQAKRHARSCADHGMAAVGK